MNSFAMKSCPLAVCIELQRFNTDGIKNNKKIEISEDLELLTVEYEQIKYKLKSVVSFHGNDRESGDYTTQAFRRNKFYLFNDSTVSEISFKQDELLDSYVLFYEKVNESLPTHPLIDPTCDSSANKETDKPSPKFIGNKNICTSSNDTLQSSSVDVCVDRCKPVSNHLDNDKSSTTSNLIQNRPYDLMKPDIHKPISERKESKKKPKIVWIMEDKNLFVEESDWLDVFDESEQKFFTRSYPSYFRNKLNKEFENIPCVINGKDNYVTSADIAVVLLKCASYPCLRQYRLKTNLKTTQYPKCMTVERNDVDIHHEYLITSYVKGKPRDILQKELINCDPAQYLAKVTKELTFDIEKNKLYHKKNAQDAKSETTIRKVREEALALQDLDKHDIIDLQLMKIREDADFDSGNKYAQNIRFVSSDPFSVFAFNRRQCEILAEEKRRRGILYGHCDATGSVVRKPNNVTKRIFYYTFVIPMMPEYEDKNCKIFPFLEMVSSAHDTYQIGIWLKKFKLEFCNLYPNMWPILNYVSTDFSLAIINSILLEWNRLTMTEYLQKVFDNLDDLSKLDDITLIQICCSHLSNNFADDINSHFLTDHARNVVKEIIAGMFNISKIDELKEYWRNLSIILRSKYNNSLVKTAMNCLTKYLLDDYPMETVEEPDFYEDDDIKKTNKNLPDYKESPFYKLFLSLEYKNEFFKENGSDELNEFYSNGFADTMMGKYIPILPLWTCLTVSERQSNGRNEVLFKIIKKRILGLACRLGSAPIKCGRFLTEMREYINEIIRQYDLKLPRRGLCTPKNRKRNLDGDKILKNVKKEKICSQMKLKRSRDTFNSQLNTIDEEMEFEDLIHSLPVDITSDKKKFTEVLDKHALDRQRKSKLPYESTPKRRKFNEIDLNDPNPVENWKGSFSKTRGTYFDFKYLQKSRKYGFQKNTKIKPAARNKAGKLNENNPPKENGKKASKVNELKNCLKYDPSTYVNKKHLYTVAFLNKYKISNSDYDKIAGENELSDGLIEFVFKIYEKKSSEMGKSIQFEVSRTHLLCFPNKNNVRLPKIEKNIVIAGLLRGGHYTLFIIDKVNKTFSYLDPMKNNVLSTKTHFNSFQDFILRHNTAYPGITLPSSEQWTVKYYEHALQQDSFNCGVFIIHFAKDFMEKRTISAESFCPVSFREYIQHSYKNLVYIITKLKG